MVSVSFVSAITILSSSGTGDIVIPIVSNSANVSNFNISSELRTSSWAGLFGRFESNIILQDASSNSLYFWKVFNFTDSVIYATNGSVSSFESSNIVASSPSVATFPVKGSGSDSFENTFNESGTFSSSSLSIPNTNFTRTLVNDADSSLNTYALYAQNDDVQVYASKSRGSTIGFNGTSIDFQMIVPALESGSSYNIYFELR